ncbi:MAG TPA: hypothetical protein PLZ51_13090, partial [Aggregatilineales bacterium]|nr:hypothetical protein [Aggregatilineales bacterium]
RQTGQIITANIPFYPPSSGQIINTTDFSIPSISDDGRYVAFQARATGVTPDVPNGDTISVFRHDALTGETLR